MTAIICVGTVCVTLLVALALVFDFYREMQGGKRLIDQLEARLSTLERSRSEHFDPKAFSELKDKVEALRIAQGLKGHR